MIRLKTHLNIIRRAAIYSSLISLGLLAGCANPADDISEAVIDETKAVQDTDPSQAVTYKISEKSKIEFTGSKITAKRLCGFNRFSGSFMVAEKTLVAAGSKVDVDIASVWSGNDHLTKSLLSPQLFNVEAYPIASFTATSIEASGESHEITGNLNICGTSKSISFPAKIEITESRLYINAEFYIRRFDFGITAKGNIDDLIRNEVVIHLSIIATPETQGTIKKIKLVEEKDL